MKTAPGCSRKLKNRIERKRIRETGALRAPPKVKVPVRVTIGHSDSLLEEKTHQREIVTGILWVNPVAHFVRRQK